MQETTVSISSLRLKLPTPQQVNAAGRMVALTPPIEAALNRNAVVAIGVSGGKDSVAVALAVGRHLDDIGHAGPRVLVHSDLGRVEWKESLPECERLAAKMGWELIVCRRNAGDMLARWEGRWKANLKRYTDLTCVKLILPWSTPSMRFCTSELKARVISSTLRNRFRDQEIINVTGIRREESANRAKMPISAPNTGLTRKNAPGITWNAVIEWEIGEVLQEISDAGLALHEAYTKYGVSRVSCTYCIMSSEADLIASAGCEDNHDVYRSMVELEAASGFGFQGNRWLADVAPHLLSPELIERVEAAKRGAALRVAAEKLLPKHLHFTKGWPTAMPTADEAELIASVRRDVAAAVGIDIGFTVAADVTERYAELMAAKALKGGTEEEDEESAGEQLALL